MKSLPVKQDMIQNLPISTHFQSVALEAKPPKIHITTKQDKREDKQRNK